MNIPAEVAAWLPLGFGAEVILDRAEPKNRLEVSKELVRNYPPRFRDQRIGGEVTFAVRVDTTGMVSGWHMLESSGYAEFDNVARMVIRKMRYKPLRSQNQCAVPALLLVPIVFKTMG